MKGLLDLHKLNINFISSLQPESNRAVERFYYTLIEHLRLLSKLTEFKDEIIFNKVSYAVIAYNYTIQSVNYLKSIEIQYRHLQQDLHEKYICWLLTKGDRNPLLLGCGVVGG